MRGGGSARRACAVAACVALVLGTLASCAQLPMRPMRADAAERAAIAAHPSAPASDRTLSPAYALPGQRDATVRDVWRTIRERYYDPGFAGKDIARFESRTREEAVPVDNDAAFYRVLKRNVRALDDSHTLILTPRESESTRAFRATQIGIVYDVVDGVVVIDRVVPNFPADRAGIRGGMILDAVDGQRLDLAYLDRPRDAPDETASEPASTGAADAERSRRLRAVRALLVPPAAQADPTVPHRLTLRRADDSVFDVTVQAVDRDVPTRVTHRLLRSGVGVLAFNRFDIGSRDALRVAFEQLADAKAIVVDLRGNGGGEEYMFLWLLGRFVAQPTPVGELRARTGAPQALVAVPGRPVYRGPLAVLVDRGTASASELTAHALVEQRGAIAVGDTTCGCVVAIRGEFVLPDGGALHVSERGYRSARGRRMEHDPLQPSIAIKPTLEQRRRGEDVALGAAERALLAELASPTGANPSSAASDR